VLYWVGRCRNYLLGLTATFGKGGTILPSFSTPPTSKQARAVTIGLNDTPPFQRHAPTPSTLASNTIICVDTVCGSNDRPISVRRPVAIVDVVAFLIFEVTLPRPVRLFRQIPVSALLLLLPRTPRTVNDCRIEPFAVSLARAPKPASRRSRICPEVADSPSIT
jgi:hypothetical protein